MIVCDSPYCDSVATQIVFTKYSAKFADFILNHKHCMYHTVHLVSNKLVGKVEDKDYKVMELSSYFNLCNDDKIDFSKF